jgi:hypothetical protein
MVRDNKYHLFTGTKGKLRVWKITAHSKVTAQQKKSTRPSQISLLIQSECRERALWQSQHSLYCKYFTVIPNMPRLNTACKYKYFFSVTWLNEVNLHMFNTDINLLLIFNIIILLWQDQLPLLLLLGSQYIILLSAQVNLVENSII